MALIEENYTHNVTLLKVVANWAAYTVMQPVKQTTSTHVICGFWKQHPPPNFWLNLFKVQIIIKKRWHFGVLVALPWKHLNKHWPSSGGQDGSCGVHEHTTAISSYKFCAASKEYCWGNKANRHVTNTTSHVRESEPHNSHVTQGPCLRQSHMWHLCN